jgi:hypothetical protein
MEGFLSPTTIMPDLGVIVGRVVGGFRRFMERKRRSFSPCANGEGFVVSHPSHDGAVGWMGHPRWWLGEEGKAWVGHLPGLYRSGLLRRLRPADVVQKRYASVPIAFIVCRARGVHSVRRYTTSAWPTVVRAWNGGFEPCRRRKVIWGDSGMENIFMIQHAALRLIGLPRKRRKARYSSSHCKAPELADQSSLELQLSVSAF